MNPGVSGTDMLVYLNGPDLPDCGIIGRSGVEIDFGFEIKIQPGCFFSYWRQVTSYLCVWLSSTTTGRWSLNPP